MYNTAKYQNRIKNNKYYLEYIISILQHSKSETDTQYIWDNCLTFRYYTQMLAFHARFDNPIIQQLEAYADVFFTQLDTFSINKKLPVDHISAPSYISELKRKIEHCLQFISAIDVLEKQRVINTALNINNK